MDQRAGSIENFGIQPQVKMIFEKNRAINRVILETKGKEPEARIPSYKRKYQPITSYMKRLEDSRIQPAMFGGQMRVFRPGINQ